MTPLSQQFSPEDQSEVFFSHREISDAVAYHLRAKRLRQLGPRLYTNNMTDPDEVIVRRNVWAIAAGYFPGAVIADRSAIEFQPCSDGSLFLVAKSTRSVQLPGLRLRPRHGAGPVEGDRPWMSEDLFMSSRARAFLENMRPSRSRNGFVARTLTQEELEIALDSFARRDSEELNRVRDRARELAPELDASDELEALNRLISALHGTGPGKLVSHRGQARSKGLAYDEHRVSLFEDLHRQLLSEAPARGQATPADLRVFAFFEAYFSNFIEGTEFELDEAKQIVFAGKIPAQRPADAHDILGTYRLVSDDSQRQRVPENADHLVEILQAQHRRMLDARPDVAPGEFKLDPNRAGQTQFVEPNQVEGTLRESFRFWASLPGGFARAVFGHFVVSEVHPFADGNGRMARLLMNSELTAAGQQRIIVPTHSRSDYLAALRAMTHNRRASTLVLIMEKLQEATAAIDFSTLDEAEGELNARGAFDDASEAERGGLFAAIEQAGR